MSGTIKICRYNKNATGWCEKMKDYCAEGPCDSEEMVEYAPVKYGRWEESEQYKGYCLCSQCHNCYIELGFTEKNKFRHCPSCGAIMEKAGAV